MEEGLNPNLLLLIPAIAAILANFFEINETDPAWLKVVKKVVNLLGINITNKAGK